MYLITNSTICTNELQRTKIVVYYLLSLTYPLAVCHWEFHYYNYMCYTFCLSCTKVYMYLITNSIICTSELQRTKIVVYYLPSWTTCLLCVAESFTSIFTQCQWHLSICMDIDIHYGCGVWRRCYCQPQICVWICALSVWICYCSVRPPAMMESSDNTCACLPIKLLSFLSFRCHLGNREIRTPWWTEHLSLSQLPCVHHNPWNQDTSLSGHHLLSWRCLNLITHCICASHVFFPVSSCKFLKFALFHYCTVQVRTVPLSHVIRQECEIWSSMNFHS